MPIPRVCDQWGLARLSLLEGKIGYFLGEIARRGA
jgi:hypothetical protein